MGKLRTPKAAVDLWNYSGTYNLQEEETFTFTTELKMAIICQNLMSRKLPCLPFGFHPEATCDCNIDTVEGCHYSAASHLHVSSPSLQQVLWVMSLPVSAEMRLREVRLVLRVSAA